MSRAFWRLIPFCLVLAASACGAAREPTAEGAETAANLLVTTYARTLGGMPGKGNVSPAALTFDIAPMVDGKPAFEQALQVSSDARGEFKINLAPGIYWLGARQQIEDPSAYQALPFSIGSQVVEVSTEQISRIELYLTGYAP